MYEFDIEYEHVKEHALSHETALEALTYMLSYEQLILELLGDNIYKSWLLPPQIMIGEGTIILPALNARVPTVAKPTALLEVLGIMSA